MIMLLLTIPIDRPTEVHRKRELIFDTRSSPSESILSILNHVHYESFVIRLDAFFQFCIRLFSWFFFSLYSAKHGHKSLSPSLTRPPNTEFLLCISCTNSQARTHPPNTYAHIRCCKPIRFFDALSAFSNEGSVK